MPTDKYAAMKATMKECGPTSIDKIWTAQKRLVFKDPSILEDILISVGGSHRLRGSKELKWPKIRHEFHPEIDSEEKAREVGFRKNEEHGKINPYKLAENWQWFIKKCGMTQEQIAKKHGIDRTTVTRILSLNNIPQDVRKKLAGVPRFTVSHLESIGALPNHLQRKAADLILEESGKYGDYPGGPTVEDVDDLVTEMKRDEAVRIKLQKAASEAKFPKCPKCSKAPDEFRYYGGNADKCREVQCEDRHDWNLDTGLKRDRIPVASGPSSQSVPQSIHCKRTSREFLAVFKAVLAKVIPTIREAEHVDLMAKSVVHKLEMSGHSSAKLWAAAKGVLPDIDRIESLTVVGRDGRGRKISVDANLEWSVSLKVDIQGGDKFDLGVSKCALKDRPEIKTRVGLTGYSSSIESKEDLNRIERQVQELFREYGPRESAKQERRRKG